MYFLYCIYYHGTIGLCTNNSLSSSSAEDSNVINNWSGSNLQSAVTVINGEKHFMLESTSSQLDPYLSQAINLTKNTNYTIYFRYELISYNIYQSNYIAVA